MFLFIGISAIPTINEDIRIPLIWYSGPSFAARDYTDYLTKYFSRKSIKKKTKINLIGNLFLKVMREPKIIVNTLFVMKNIQKLQINYAYLI